MPKQTNLHATYTLHGHILVSLRLFSMLLAAAAASAAAGVAVAAGVGGNSSSKKTISAGSGNEWVRLNLNCKVQLTCYSTALGVI